MEPKILIVEDDRHISNLIKLYLDRQGFETLQAFDGEEAKELFLKHSPCLIMLDLMLPRVSGEEFCSWVLREGEAENPAIIILSAKASTEDRIKGLRLGADDYMTKPFSPEEMVVKVEAVLRRTGRLCQKITDEGLVLKPRKGEVWLNGSLIELTSYEFNLLFFLMENPGQVYSREQLVEQIHPYAEVDIFPRTIDAHIKKLRKKVEEDPAHPKRILTVRGMGYKYGVT